MVEDNNNPSMPTNEHKNETISDHLIPKLAMSIPPKRVPKTSDIPLERLF